MLINVCISDVQNRVLTHLATNWEIFRVKFVLWLVNGPKSVVVLLCFAQERACCRDSFVSFCHWSRLVFRLSQGGHGVLCFFFPALGLSPEPCELEEEGHLTVTIFPGPSLSQQFHHHFAFGKHILCLVWFLNQF